MKREIPFLLILTILLIGCSNQNKRTKPLDPNYHKNLYTQEIFKSSEMGGFIESLHKKYADSIVGNSYITIQCEELIVKGDSIIQPFKYDVRVGTEYKIRSRSYEKIGMKIEPIIFQSINGDSIQIGGVQTKPTVINLWFIGCGGCVAEIPALNRLQEKYADKVNFIAFTFDNDKDVRKFLKKTSFNYTHVASKDWKHEETSLSPYIKTIESYPYPENIFIDKNGTIRYVEGILGNKENLDFAIKHFEMIIEKLLHE